MKKQSQKESTEIMAFKSRLVAYNKECEEKVKEEKIVMLLKDRLDVLGLEHDLINKVDCLEERILAKKLEGDMMRIAKLGYAQAQDPLTKINLGDDGEDLLIFISQLLNKEVSNKLISLLKEYKDRFAWEYEQMPDLDRNVVDHRLPTKPNFKLHKQPPRRFASNMLPEVKKEIEQLLKVGFIRTTRYIEWLSNIVHVFKKNGKIRVCIDFRNLNVAMPKDVYPMPMIDSLVDFNAGYVMYCFLDGTLDVNYQFFFTLDDLCTNNQAEYEELIVGLELLLEM
ncbi:Reverse transcriptase domain-containing protein [Abeliophyllum distichum]|uniref:Reverse transcriptase domain-containing protein n=1 Tax=Abeliophyllum distichum TaxID=126358 RepID=A0ABD1R9Z7_9LAMI